MRFSIAPERGWKIKEVFTIFLFWLVKNWYFIHEEILEHAQNILSAAAHIVLCWVYVDKFRIRLCIIKIWERNLSKVQKFIHSKNKHSLSNIYRMWGFSLLSASVPLLLSWVCGIKHTNHLLSVLKDFVNFRVVNSRNEGRKSGISGSLLNLQKAFRMFAHTEMRLNGENSFQPQMELVSSA